uniref:outer membrane protein OmpA n=1 Tax=Polynucleobacter sp. TaxID=2029855 RepID=UPI0040470BD0
MKKLLQLLAVAVIAISSSAFAQKSVDNWVNSTGIVWKNGTNELCWRNANWTPATAAPGCDGAIAAAAPAAPAAPKPAGAKVTLNADALFDFDKSALKPAAIASLDSLAGKVKSLTLEVIVAVGHTDSIGTDAYNQKLSIRRAEAVKKHLVNQGIEARRIYIEGKGESQPVADNKTNEGRAMNRRVQIEAIGTRAQ